MKNLSDVFYYKLVNDDGSINYRISYGNSITFVRLFEFGEG